VLYGSAVSPSRGYPACRKLYVAVMFDRITFQPQILGGRACIRGMRIPVSVIVGAIAHGASIAEVVSDHPEQDVRQALEYAAWLATEEVHSTE
jgi:uncharacterized protein (DUF433 family)